MKNLLKNIDLEKIGLKSYAFGPEEAQLEAVKKDGYAIQYIHNPTEEVQLAAVKKDGYAIRFIHNPTEKVQLEVVKQDGDAIRFIHNPSEEVRLEAVKKDRNAIRFIHNPSEKVQEIAVSSTNKLFPNITSEKVIKEFLKKNNLINDESDMVLEISGKKYKLMEIL